jgi:hypothetical protein
MDPIAIGPGQWEQLVRGVLHLFLFLGLMVNTAISFLVAHAIIPSLVTTGDALPDIQSFRRVLYPISALSLLLTIFAFGRMVSLAIPTLQQIYPRFAI